MPHVYVIERPDGLVKIGFSADPTKRLRSLETQSGFDATHAWVSIPVENAKAVESKAHEKLSAHRAIGEWFKADFDDAIQTVIDVLSGKCADEIGASWQDNARAIARDRGITIAQIAQALNVTPGCVGHWLSGRRTASVDEAEQIAAALGVTLTDLLSPALADESMPERLLLALKSKGITQNALANALDVSKGTVSHWIASRHGISTKQIEQIAIVLGVSPEWLAFGRGPSDENATKADSILSRLSPEHRAQALRMLEAFAASVSAA